MKILLVSHYTLPHVGGIEVLVDQHSRHLAQRGHEVTVLSSRVDGQAQEQRGDVHVIRVAAWNFLERWLHVLSSTVGSEAWNSRDLKSRPH